MLADPAGMSTCTDLRRRNDADVSHRNNAEAMHPLRQGRAGQRSLNRC
jgi:hypothetical protein